MKVILLAFYMLISRADAGIVVTKNNSFLNGVVGEVINILPANFLSSINETIIVEETLSSAGKSLESADLCQIDEGVKLGFLKSNKIFINSQLVMLAKNNHTVFNCGHRTFLNLLKAVIIHEFTHVKDNKEKISLNPDFQRIVGVKRITLNTKKKVMNQAIEVSADPYEFKNLEESLAVNVEYLILDPEFECRKPASAEFLSKRLGVKLKGECNKNFNLLVQSSFIEDNYRTSASIDPQRIYQIHYLFAGRGEALMSRWGHAMFRLIVCAPFRSQVGPDCLDDVSHHLVLSYRANINDLTLSYAKGLLGGYPSQLFVLRYLEVQQEYTKFDLRDLYSIPLKMTADQKKEFLNLSLERFWTYQGKYYFLENNCGTEVVKQLSVILPDSESKLINSITPLKIYNDIINSKNSLTEVGLDSLPRGELINRGFLIESMFENFNKSFEFLKNYIPSFYSLSMQEFIKGKSASDRLRDYEKIVLDLEKYDFQERKQIVMKIIHLERFITSKYLQKIPSKLMKLMQNDSGLRQELIKLSDDFKVINLQPWEVVEGRYGVPTSQEFVHQYSNFVEKKQITVRKDVESLMNSLNFILNKKHFAKELYELSQFKKINDLTVLLLTSFKNELGQKGSL